jgi:hypothetical protein
MDADFALIRNHPHTQVKNFLGKGTLGSNYASFEKLQDDAKAAEAALNSAGSSNAAAEGSVRALCAQKATAGAWEIFACSFRQSDAAMIIYAVPPLIVLPHDLYLVR